MAHPESRHVVDRFFRAIILHKRQGGLPGRFIEIRNASVKSRSGQSCSAWFRAASGQKPRNREAPHRSRKPIAETGFWAEARSPEGPRGAPPDNGRTDVPPRVEVPADRAAVQAVELKQRQSTAEQASRRHEKQHVSRSQRVVDQGDSQEGGQDRQDRTDHQALIRPDLIQRQGGNAPAGNVLISIKHERCRFVIHVCLCSRKANVRGFPSPFAQAFPLFYNTLIPTSAARGTAARKAPSLDRRGKITDNQTPLDLTGLIPAPLTSWSGTGREGRTCPRTADSSLLLDG